MVDTVPAPPEPPAPIPSDPYERVRLGVALRMRAPALNFPTRTPV